MLVAATDVEAALVGELVERLLPRLAKEPIVYQRGLVGGRKPSKHHNVVSHDMLQADTACAEDVAVHFGDPWGMPALHIGIPCANTRRRTESRRGGAGASGFVLERTSRIVLADAIDLPVALRVFPHRLCVVEPRRHEPFEVLHGDAVEAAHLVQAAEDLRPHKLCSHPVIRSIKISVRCGGSHATPNGQVSLAVDWLPKNHVRLHHQDVVGYGRRRVLEQPVVKGTRLVVRCIVVLHEVVLGATIVRMHVGRADVQTGVSLIIHRAQK